MLMDRPGDDCNGEQRWCVAPQVPIYGRVSSQLEESARCRLAAVSGGNNAYEAEIQRAMTMGEVESFNSIGRGSLRGV